MNDRHSPIGAAASAVPHWNTLFASARAAPVAGTNWADVLARLFDPQLGSLPPFCIPSILGSNRTPAEAFALASAVACPDLFLFDALPGPGRVPVLATLAAESVQAGNRVLILAEPAQADLIVTRLADRHPGIGVARALAPGESVERLLTASAKRTAAALAPGVIESVRKKLSHARAECDASHQRLEALPAHLETFREFLNQSQRLTDDEAKSRVEHSRVHTEAESAIQSVKAEQLTAMQSHEELLQSAQNLLESRNAELATVRQKLDEATAEAKKRRGALGYLRTLIVGDDGSSQLSELQPRLAEAETAAQNAASEVARLTQLRDAKIAEQTTELARVLQLEIQRREAEIEAKLAVFAGQRKALTDSIRGSVQAFVDAGFQIHDPISPEEVERLAAEWESHRARLHAELVGITRHESEVESPVFLSRAFTEVPVVVAPLSALGSDLLTPDPSANLFFDQLLIADADRLTEPELHTATRHATRWILMGDGTTPSTGPPTPRNGQPTSLTRTGFFPKLWASMHRPTWMYDTGRLIVQLAEAVRTELRTEPLADCPDVELRFADQANGDVILVQVAFPAGFSILDARSLLLKELGEFRLHPWGPKHWHETADRLTLCYPAAETGLRPVGWFGLQPGVREKVTSNGTDVFTAAVQFDRSAGWTRESAEAWLAEHLPMTESVRTAVVPRPVTVPTPDPVRTMAGIAG